MTGVHVLDPADDAHERIRTAADKALKRQRPALHEIARKQVATVVASLLDLDLSDYIADGWRGYDEVVGAAERTVGRPNETETVVVEEHSFRTDRSDEFTIALDGTTLDTVPAELSFVFVIRGLVVTVRDGCIVSLDSGRCEITALVQVSGVDLDAVTGTSDLRLTLAVTPPIRIRPWPQTPRPADEPREVVMPDTVKDRQRQRRASPAGSPPSKDLA